MSQQVTVTRPVLLARVNIFRTSNICIAEVNRGRGGIGGTPSGVKNSITTVHTDGVSWKGVRTNICSYMLKREQSYIYDQKYNKGSESGHENKILQPGRTWPISPILSRGLRDLIIRSSTGTRLLPFSLNPEIQTSLSTLPWLWDTHRWNYKGTNSVNFPSDLTET